MAKLSGLQRSVLHLYRDCLRAARQKPVVRDPSFDVYFGLCCSVLRLTKSISTQEYRNNFRQFARDEFKKNSQIDRKDFAAIEYLVRKGQRQLETYRNETIRNVGH
jgi:succinate dehydrogenase assembly factor 1